MGNATESRVPGLVTRSLTACLLSLFVFSTFLGNALVCAAVVRFRHLRSKVAYVFVMSLAVSDLFVATLVMPWRAVTEVAGFWPFGSFCEVWIAFDIMCSTASILNLCIISVDRYWAIASPFNYEQKMTCQAALIMIAVAWTLSILISFIPVQLNWHKAQGIPLDLRTTESVKQCDTSLNRTYAITSSLISFYIPVAIMIVTYTRIFFIVQKQIRRISTQECTVCCVQSCRGCSQVPENRLKTSLKKETIVLKTLTIIMGVFVCCWLPFFILNCMVPFCNPSLHHSNQLTCVSETTFDVFVWFGWANSTLNPVVYAAFNADFRRAFSVLLGCERLCSRTRVETVNFSNELASYHHDTTNPRDPQTFSQPYLLPHAVRESNDKDVCFDSVSEMVEVKGENKLGYLLTDSLPFLNHETELSLDKITPFTPAPTPPCMTHVTHNPKVSSNVSGIL